MVFRSESVLQGTLETETTLYPDPPAYKPSTSQLGETRSLHDNLSNAEHFTTRPNPLAPRQPLQKHSTGHLAGVGYAVVGRANAGWTTSKSGRPRQC